jgi:chemosensory pili system protein ChpA (sensor histidine kinase/response regulator)
MKRIYMVDDEKDQIDVATALLEGKGYAVAGQQTDESVCENIREFNADLILLDAMFPEDETAGFRIARLIRQDEKLKDKPIIMLSSVNSQGHFPGKFSSRDIDDAYFPVSEFMEKPLDVDALVAKIEELT